eukprot:364208-Chlamydomonas_euryale.AAC.4
MPHGHAPVVGRTTHFQASGPPLARQVSAVIKGPCTRLRQHSEGNQPAALPLPIWQLLASSAVTKKPARLASVRKRVQQARGGH